MTLPTINKKLSLTTIVALGIVIYSNSFDCSFHFDDIHDIVDNEKMKNINDIWNYNPRRAVGFFTLALNYHIHKLNVFGYHLINFIIHSEYTLTMLK